MLGRFFVKILEWAFAKAADCGWDWGLAWWLASGLCLRTQPPWQEVKGAAMGEQKFPSIRGGTSDILEAEVDLNNALRITAGAESFAPQSETTEQTHFMVPCTTQTADLLERGIIIRDHHSVEFRAVVM